MLSCDMSCDPQFIHPADSHKLEQAELLCIDEAAAIPLPLVRRLLGTYLVFMASTVNGYHMTVTCISHDANALCVGMKAQGGPCR